jgi:hypothetical protein
VVLLEIAAQGVPGFAPAGGRLALRPGYNVVAADGPALRRLLEALWYPESPATAVPRPPGGGPAARAGLTLVGDDGVTWRVVRDLAAGVQLQRFDPERRAFQGASTDPARVAAALRQAGVPAPSRLAALLAVGAADLPSRRAAPPPGAVPAAPTRRALSPEEARRRRDDLARELDQARVAEKLQYQLDGLQSRLFKLEELLRAGEQIRERLRAAEQVASAQAEGGSAPALDDPPARIAAHGRAVARRDEALAKIAAEQAALAEAEERGRPPPPWRDRVALAGAGGAVVALAAALVTGLRPIALLAIPAAGVSAYLALRWVGELEGAERAGRRRQILEERERKAKESFERDTADVRAAMKALGVESVTELAEAMQRRAAARTAAAEARDKLAEWEASPDARQAAEEKARLQEEIGEIERRLGAEAGAYVRDPRSIEAELQRLDADPAASAEPEPAPVAAPRPPPAAEALRGLLDQAVAELGAPAPAVLRSVQPRVGQLLPAISAQRFAGFLVDERGNLLVQGGGKTVPAAGLTPGDRDLCWIALRVGLLEQALAAGKAVAVLEDAFGGLPDASRRALGRLLKQLGRAGQIVHATADAAFRESADHAG